jgi:hypothetical protein
MPKRTEYRIAWSEARQAYELDHTPFLFSLSDATLQTWLSRMEAFHFHAASGESFTARKERKQRGSAYWYAYRRVGGKLQKKYLGDGTNITLTLLVSIARAFVATPEPVPEPERVQPPPRKPTLRFTRTLASALAIFGLTAVPTKASLTSAYRELVKRHHPDVGGLHEDMVAVNLAYDYLKRYGTHQ